jgi:hypothetical protein
MPPRLGEILVAHGVLTESDVDRILAVQRETGEPFGLISERLCGVDPGQVEVAWTEQYRRLTETVDTQCEAFDPSVHGLVSRRQAWQFRLVPVRRDGDHLRVLTTGTHLRRALNFAIRVLGMPSYIVLTDPQSLGALLCERYPMGGMTPASVDDGELDKLLGRAPGGVGAGRAS